MQGYNLGLVVVSYALSAFGSFVALILATQPRGLRRMTDKLWFAGAAFALGAGGIWAMNTVAMLAFDMALPVTYDTPLMLGSLLTGVVFTGGGFVLAHVIHASQPRSLSALSVAGAIMGCGVASAHYMGMAGMRMAASLEYDSILAAVSSIAITIVASTLALWLAFNAKKGSHKFMAACVMGTGISGMHYIALAGARFAPAATQVDLFQHALTRSDLDAAVVMVTVSLLTLGVFSVFARHLSDARATAQ